MVRRRIVVVTGEVLAARLAGPAIRAREFARALSRDHDVTLVSTASCELTDEIEHSGGGTNVEAGEILDVIRTLPIAYKETLVLRLVEGMTGPEIAGLTGLTPESVRVNLHRGMRMLRQKLGIEVK